jgi:hypothetical protein
MIGVTNRSYCSRVVINKKRKGHKHVCCAQIV